MTKPKPNDEPTADPGQPEVHMVDTGKEGEPDAEKIDALKARAGEAEKYYDQLLRARAEFDNYKKRVRQEQQYAELAANEKLFQRLLTVLDTFDLALASAEKAENVKAVIEGVRMVQKQLQNVLGESGVEEIDATHKPFDPNWHEAIQQAESVAHPEGTVMQQVRKGYRFKDRLLRAAAVIVSKKPETRG